MSTQSSAKATLAEAHDCEWYGRLFEISTKELDALDRAEGKGYGYKRYDDFEVFDLGPGELRTVKTYLADGPQEGFMPFHWYVGLIVAGYLQAELPTSQIYNKGLHAFLLDKDDSRDGFQKAVKAIEKDGFVSIDEVLLRLDNSMTE